MIQRRILAPAVRFIDGSSLGMEEEIHSSVSLGVFAPTSSGNMYTKCCYMMYTQQSSTLLTRYALGKICRARSLSIISFSKKYLIKLDLG